MRLWLLALILAILHPIASVQAAQPSNEAIIRNHYRLLNAGDYRRAAEDFAESTAHQGVGRTRAATLRVLEDIYGTFPDWRMEIVDLVASGDSVVVRSKVSGTHRGTGKFNVNGGLLTGVSPTGRRFEVEHIHWYKMRDGKIAEHFATRNDIDMARQLGVLPAAGRPRAAAAPDPRLECSPELKSAIRRMEVERVDAGVRKDVASVAAVTADDYMQVDLNGLVRGKTAAMERIRSSEILLSENRLDEMRVRCVGDSAVIVTARSKARGTIAGQEFPPIRYSRVYVNRGGRWQVILFQMTPITSGSAVAAKAASADAELRRVDLEQAAVAQSGDLAAMTSLLHPNYIAHLTNGRLYDRAQTIAFVASGSLAKERFQRTQETVVVAGDTGIVMGLDKLESPPPLATKGERNRRYTNVYVRDSGRWKLLARHFHLLP